MSLTERLRLAALERARQSGQMIDNYVLEPTGVIDLREMEMQPVSTVDNSVALPALGQHTEVDALYGKSLADTRLWKRVRGTMTANHAEVESVEVDTDSITIDLTEHVPLIEVEQASAPENESALDAQPTAPCQRCGATAKRDLIDIFHSLEYFSCDDCGHMWQQRLDG